MTRLFGVMGDPITHSLSPVLHAAAFAAWRLDALYEPFQVPQRFLAPILRALTNAGVEGLNVTVPLKEAVMPLLDRMDPTARAIGAVNTIVVRNGRLAGFNTDAVGFLRALEELRWRRGPVRAVILGAGGSARAVAWALAQSRGSRLVIANRHPERAAALHRRLLVYDLVYNRSTALVQAGRRRGCVAANGLSMLLYQGAESLRLWLHRPPPLEAMRRALTTKLNTRRFH